MPPDDIVDLLLEDPPMSGQKYVCMSFVSPETFIKQKEHFYVEEFLRQQDITSSLERFTDYLAFIAAKYDVPPQELMSELESFVTEEKAKLKSADFNDDFKAFLEAHSDRLDAKFDLEHGFQTSVRSVKIRGSFDSEEEAGMRAQMLRRKDPDHNIYVGPVGMWMPWDPDAYKTGRVEYLDEAQNKLMQEKAKSDKRAKDEFETRVTQKKREAIQRNKDIAAKTGGAITQDIDGDGNLVSVGAAGDGAASLHEVASGLPSASMAGELFGDNVVIGGK
jgi:hypothetical protein